MTPPAEARRLTGPNRFSPSPGATLDVTWQGEALPTDAQLDALAERWRGEVRAALAAPGWPPPEFGERRGGADGACVLSLFASAPVDALDLAVEVAEQAWAAAADAAGSIPPAPPAPAPRVARLLDGADAHALPTTWDDDAVSIGAGRGSRTWPADALPDPDAVDWTALGGAPIALVTGSNGKTTTTRLVAAILRAAGHTVGSSSTDGVRVQGPDGADAEVLEEGDWAGPGGARLVLRHPRVTAAVLETARGGILRRGLAVRRATAAAVTNIAADHFGDYGIFDLQALAEAKLVVARALVATGGPLVLHAGDATLRDWAAGHPDTPPLIWVASDPADLAASAWVAAHVARGGRAAAVADGAAGAALRWHDGAAWHHIVRLAELTVADGGAVAHNVANAAVALALGIALGAPPAAAGDALRHFGRGPDDNPGRLERLRVGDVTALVDYAHNPAGLTALLDAARAIPAARRILVLGQAGDRDDGALADLARAAWTHGTVSRVQLKDIPAMHRGRAPGEVPAVLRRALAAVGAPDDAVAAEVAATEGDAVRRALAWARPGDLLLLPLHVDRAELVTWLRSVDAAGWRAGAPLPP